jgi:hypothetical protein
MAHGVARLAEAVVVGDCVGFCVGGAVGLAVVGFFVGEGVGLSVVVGFFVGEGVGLSVVVGFFVGEGVLNESSQAHWHTPDQGSSPPANTLEKPNAERNW